MTSKAKKLVKSSITGQISFVVRIIITLFMTPFLISSLGDYNYGLWILVTSFTGFYGLLDIGLTTAVQRYLSRALGTNDYEEANTIFNTSLFAFSLIGLVALLLVFVLSSFAHVFVKDTTNLLLFRKIMVLLGVGLAFSFPMRSFWAIFPCHLRWDINIKLDLLNIIIKTVLIVFFLNGRHGIWSLAVINFLADMTNYLLNVSFSLKIAPYIRISTKYFSKSKIKGFLKYSIFSFVSRIANLIKFSIDNLVISAFVGVNSIAIYSIAIRLIQYFTQIVSKSTGFMMPVFSRYEAINDYDSIRRQFIFVTKICSIISVLLGSMLAIFGRDFIILWIGGNYVESYELLLIFVIPFTISFMQLPSYHLLYGISKHKMLSVFNITEAICNLILSLILVRYLGLKGVAFGTAVPLLVLSFFVLPVYVCRVLNIKAKFYFLKVILPIVLKSSLLMLPMWLLTRTITIDNYFSLIFIGMIYGLCYGIIMFSICFSLKEQNVILSAIPYKIAVILKKERYVFNKI